MADFQNGDRVIIRAGAWCMDYGPQVGEVGTVVEPSDENWRVMGQDGRAFIFYPSELKRVARVVSPAEPAAPAIHPRIDQALKDLNDASLAIAQATADQDTTAHTFHHLAVEWGRQVVHFNRVLFRHLEETGQ